MIFSLWAQKLNQQPAVMYDMGNREEAIDNKGPENSLKASVHLICQKCIFLDSMFTTNISHNTSIWGTLAWLPHIIHHKLKN